MAVKGLKSEPNYDRDNFNGDGDNNNDVKYGSDTWRTTYIEMTIYL